MKKRRDLLVMISLTVVCCLGMGIAVYFGARETFNRQTLSISTAPPDTPVILAPSELPVDVEHQMIPWFSGVLDLSSGQVVESALSFAAVSDRYQVYVDWSNRVKMHDLKTGADKVLVSAEEFFPGANIRHSVALSPDGRYVFFLVSWPFDPPVELTLGKSEPKYAIALEITALARVDVSSGKVVVLNIDPRFAGGLLSVSSLGEIATQCSYVRGGDLSSELCILDSRGKFLRYLTSDGGYPGSIIMKFTPDGKWVVYQNQVKPGIYQVTVEGTKRRKISDCGIPVLVTNEYAVVQCYLSLEPRCYGLFLASLEENDFRRIGYVEPYCIQGKSP